MISPTRLLLVAVVTGALIAQGCSKKKETPIEVTAAPTVAESGGKAATEKECREFADALSAAAKEDNEVKMRTLFRMDDIVQRSISDLGISQDSRESFMKGARGSLATNDLTNQILAAKKTGGDLKFLRIRTVNGQPRALYRFNQGFKGVSYLELIVARYPDGELGVEDVYVYAAGEMLTQRLRQSMMPMIATNQKLLNQLRGKDKEMLEHAKTIRDMKTKTQSRDHEGADREYLQLPESLQNDKSVMLIHIATAKGLGDENYLAALEKYENLFPDDASTDLLSIDYYIVKKQFDKALVRIDRLNKAIEGDPYLNVLRAKALAENHQFAEAAKAAESAIQAEPDSLDGYWSRLSVSLKAKMFADTLTWLQKITETFEFEFADLTKLDDYSEFVESPQYAEWTKWLAEQKKK